MCKAFPQCYLCNAISLLFCFHTFSIWHAMNIVALVLRSFVVVRWHGMWQYTLSYCTILLSTILKNLTRRPILVAVGRSFFCVDASTALTLPIICACSLLLFFSAEVVSVGGFIQLTKWFGTFKKYENSCHCIDQVSNNSP